MDDTIGVSRNMNRYDLTNERTVLHTCDLHKHILVSEMLPCETVYRSENALVVVLFEFQFIIILFN